MLRCIFDGVAMHPCYRLTLGPHSPTNGQSTKQICPPRTHQVTGKLNAPLAGRASLRKAAWPATRADAKP
eukprot:181464-Amphidinium_carterae.1